MTEDVRTLLGQNGSSYTTMPRRGGHNGKFLKQPSSALINAGVAADTIKLLGNSNSDVELAEKRAKSDAKYLLTLLTELTHGQSTEK
ncbi:hypothetical protein A3K87_09850 [Variovorax paradoxus]|uniref:Uncharacterized protein n=1 Tax=Variovorax paradoxus TaxID=34073 RepID=A0AA91ICE7_VARPD|nr:hypothetical protein [Variovorax paradoxus]OAK66059.1 hypothetical protein A3K87_09850 [Variovorax paradoxus]